MQTGRGTKAPPQIAMSEEKTPEQQAVERYPDRAFPITMEGTIALTSLLGKRQAYAACLIERAIPAEQQVKELEAEVEWLREAAEGALTVDAAIEVVLKWVYKSGEIDYNIIISMLPEEKEVGETKYVQDLRARLVARANQG